MENDNFVTKKTKTRKSCVFSLKKNGVELKYVTYELSSTCKHKVKKVKKEVFWF